MEELQRVGYRDLLEGHLKEAGSRADEGARRARDGGDRVWGRRFRVLQAEVFAADGRTAQALTLLDAVDEPSTSRDTTSIRAQMTRARLSCLASGDAGKQARAAADLAEAGRDAAALREQGLASEIARHQGTCALRLGRHSEAETHYRRSLALAGQARQPLLEVKAINNLGYLDLWRRHYDQATGWLGKALELTTRLGNDLDRVKTLTNLGWCYYLLGDYDRALNFHSQAEALAQQRGYASERQIALQNIGNVHIKRGALTRAETFYRQSLGIAREVGARKPTAELLSNLAYVTLREGRLSEAEALVTEALALKRELGDQAAIQYSLLAVGLVSARRGDPQRAESLYREVLASPHSSPELSWEGRVALAQLRVASGRLREADAEFRGAFALMEESYSELREAEHRISFFSSLDQFHDDYVDFLVAGGDSGRALEVADRGRARQLREMLRSSARGPLPSPRFDTVARTFDSVVLLYSLALPRSFLWALTPQGIQLHELPGEAEIRGHVEAHQRRVLQARDPLGEDSPDADWLYRTLVGPAEASIPPGSQVVFVPDGALYQLNPETLVVTAPKPHYWIEDVTLVTAPSISLLATGPREGSRVERARRGEGRRLGAESILLIGDPEPAGDEFPRLAQAERELERIADQFAPADRTVFSGPRAVPSAYGRSEPRRFEYIHFAAHAQASREVPLDSAIILSAEKDAAKLYARDVVKLPLRAELVTLSACRSAGSRTFAGEGLVGLGWAFLSAGAENVVAGLWNVEDASTAELMADLYRGVRHGLAPAEALREAKLGLLRSQTAYRKPFYWAPFMVYTRSPGLPGRPRGTRAAAANGPRPLAAP